MLTTNSEVVVAPTTAHSEAASEQRQSRPPLQQRTIPSGLPSRLSRALRLEWLGQTAASLFWIVSVFTYGITSVGDWLQLAAATAWLLANVSALAQVESS